MPRYFFDCFDGRDFHADPHGIDLDDDGEAAVHGACLARSLLNETMDDVGARAVTTTVRTADGAQVYMAHCTFHGLRLPDMDQPERIRMPHPSGPSKKLTPASS